MLSIVNTGICGTFTFRMAESVRSVGRALKLLENLATGGGEVALKDLSRGNGLQPPTAYRLLQTLVEHGWVVQNPATSGYRLSHKLLALVGDVEARSARLRAVARPHLETLRDFSGESTNLVVLDGVAAVYIDQVPSLRPFRMFTEIGARVPAYASGAGKAMLAFASPAVRMAVDRGPREPLTSRTLTDGEALSAALGEARTRGYAVDNEEYEPGVACIAAPICDTDGNAFAAISVSGQVERLRALDHDELAQRLTSHAHQISAELALP